MRSQIKRQMRCNAMKANERHLIYIALYVGVSKSCINTALIETVIPECWVYEFGVPKYIIYLFVKMCMSRAFRRNCNPEISGF